jgi:hypothetical protein
MTREITSGNQQMRYVRYHPPMSLAPLFRPLPKNGRRPVLDLSYAAEGSGVVLRFSAREALGVPEQTLLLALLEIAREQYVRGRAESTLRAGISGETWGALWMRLNRGNTDCEGESIRFSTTWRELNERCGSITGGSTVALRRSQLQRLCEVIVWEETTDAHRTTQQSYLVAWLLGDDAKLYLALNVRLAASVVGKPFVLVSLAERLRLESDTAKALHAYFCARVHPGNHIKVRVDTLRQRLWPDADVPDGTARRRRKAVQDALRELAALSGWEVEKVTAEVACVTRPELPLHKGTLVA